MQMKEIVQQNNVSAHSVHFKDWCLIWEIFSDQVSDQQSDDIKKKTEQNKYNKTVQVISDDEVVLTSLEIRFFILPLSY